MGLCRVSSPDLRLWGLCGSLVPAGFGEQMPESARLCTAIDLMTKTLTVGDTLENPSCWSGPTPLCSAGQATTSLWGCKDLLPDRLAWCSQCAGHRGPGKSHMALWQLLSLEWLLDPLYLISAKAAAEPCWVGGRAGAGRSCSVSATPFPLPLPLPLLSDLYCISL